MTLITGTISMIANMFLGGGSTDTAALIQNEFAKQSKLILDSFANLEKAVSELLERQTITEMYLLSEVRKLFSRMKSIAFTYNTYNLILLLT